MKIIRNITSALLCLSLGMGMCVPSKAAETAEMRRPVSPESPMWIVHIDTWYNSDPEKIIDLIPDDILPCVVFNISMNPSWSEEEQRCRHFAELWSFATNPSKILLRIGRSTLNCRTALQASG